jgi:energy-coupling factor transporter ATP-binding protein EcfA2
MAIIEGIDITYTYPAQHTPAIHQLHFQISHGDWHVICGPTGSGKSTLLNLFKTDFLAIGQMQGQLHLAGKLWSDYDARACAHLVGYVSQFPEQHIVMNRVYDELTFNMENIGLPTQTMRMRLAEMAQLFELEPLLERETISLSGGELQLVQLVSALLLRPKILVLDEPFSQLDPIATQQFVQRLAYFQQEYDLTILMSTHRLEEVWHVADCISYLENGHIVMQGTKQELIQSILLSASHSIDPEGGSQAQINNEAQISHSQAQQLRVTSFLPSMMQLILALNNCDEVPLTTKEIRTYFAKKFDYLTNHNSSHPFPEQLSTSQSGQDYPAMRMQDVLFRHHKQSPLICKNTNLTIHSSEIVALFGANGSGKSTVLQLLAGILQPQYGSIQHQISGLKNKKLDWWMARSTYPHKYEIGYISQQPMLHFMHETVEQEIKAASKHANQSGLMLDWQQIAASYGLDTKLSQHPFELSGGEKQILALACVLTKNPRILLLDEPTRGLDPLDKKKILQLLRECHLQKTTIVIATHDLEFASEIATRCLLWFDGDVAVDQSATVFFQENDFYTTPVHRLVREWLPTAIHKEDVVRVCQETFLSR